MKIKLAIIDRDEKFLNKFSIYLMKKYSNEISVSSYSRYDLFDADNEVKKFDIIWGADDVLGLDENVFSLNGFVYIVESKNLTSINGINAICKYQNPEIVYKRILNIFAELEFTNKYVFHGDIDSNTRVISVTSLAGGVGATTFSYGLCKRFLATGKSVFYLNIETFFESNILFDGEGIYGLSDIFYSVKSKKGNINLKIKSIEKIDSSGIKYFSSWSSPIDSYGVSKEDIISLIYELVKTKNYDYIIIDNVIKFSSLWFDFLGTLSNIILIGDDSKKSNYNLNKYIELFKLYETQDVINVFEKSLLVYNKVRNQTGMNDYINVMCNYRYNSKLSGVDLANNLGNSIDISKIL